MLLYSETQPRVLPDLWVLRICLVTPCHCSLGEACCGSAFLAEHVLYDYRLNVFLFKNASLKILFKIRRHVRAPLGQFAQMENHFRHVHINIVDYCLLVRASIKYE